MGEKIMSQQDREFSKAVKNTKAYEDLLIRLITLECNQDIHTEKTNQRTSDGSVYHCMNCGAEIK
jgi:DNA-directed RNA polymerase subunit RPC12/RpoP